MSEFLGTDIMMEGDLVVLPTGDAGLVSGEACLLQDIRHRLLTPRGSLWTHPEYGLDSYRFLKAEDSEMERLDLVQAIEAEVAKDPRVQPGSVRAAVRSWSLNGITVGVTFRAVRSDNPLNLVIEIGGSSDGL